jgi:hypothetical protein
MSARRLLWWLAVLLFAAAAAIGYSPRLARHAPTLIRVGLACLTLGLLAHGTVDLTD